MPVAIYSEDICEKLLGENTKLLDRIRKEHLRIQWALKCINKLYEKDDSNRLKAMKFAINCDRIVSTEHIEHTTESDFEKKPQHTKYAEIDFKQIFSGDYLYETDEGWIECFDHGAISEDDLDEYSMYIDDLIERGVITQEFVEKYKQNIEK